MSKFNGATSTEEEVVAGVGAVEVAASASLLLELLVEDMAKDWCGMWYERVRGGD